MDNEQIAREAAKEVLEMLPQFEKNTLYVEPVKGIILAAIEEAMNAEFIDRWNDLERIKSENKPTITP